MGVLDEEINLYSDEDIKFYENDDCESLKVETEYLGTKDADKEEALLKKTVIFVKVDNKHFGEIGTFYWKEMPKYRKLEEVALNWEDAACKDADQDKTVVYSSHNKRVSRYNYYYNKEDCVSNKIYTDTYKYNANPALLKNHQYFVDNKHIAAAMELQNDWEQVLYGIS